MKNVTIRDIAAEANVSISTVSRVLNDSSFVEESKCEAVKKAVKTLKYKPNVVARSLVSGQTFTIGVVANDIGSPFCGSLTQGVGMELHETKYSPIIVDAFWNVKTEREAIQNFIARGVDGVIILGGSLTLKELDQLAAEIPTIVVARELPDWKRNNIYVDNFSGAYKATNFLIDAGHRDIAFISGTKERRDATRRLEGFQKALSDRQLVFREELFVESDFLPATAVLAMETLLAREAIFTAVFCCNDLTAFGACRAMSRRGIRIPDDVSVLGFDDHPLAAYMNPPLTTVNQPGKMLGRKAAQAIIEAISNGEVAPQVIEPELVIRDSVSNHRFARNG